MRKNNFMWIFVLLISLVVIPLAHADSVIRDLGTDTVDQNINWIGNAQMPTSVGWNNTNGTYFLANVEFLITEVSAPVPNFTVYICPNVVGSAVPSGTGCIKAINDFNTTLALGRHNASFSNITINNNTAYWVIFVPFGNQAGFYRLGESLGSNGFPSGNLPFRCTSGSNISTCVGNWAQYVSSVQNLTVRLWNGTNTTITPTTLSVSPQDNYAVYNPSSNPLNRSIIFQANSTGVGDGGGSRQLCLNGLPGGNNFCQSVENATWNTTLLIPQPSLPQGTYNYTIVARNSSGNFSNVTRRFTIYNITFAVITSPANNSNLSRNLNLTWNNATVTNNITNITGFRVHLLNASFSQVITPINTSNLLLNYDLYVNNIGIGQYYVVVESFDSNGFSVNSTPVLFNHLTDALLNITANAFETGSAINIFNVTINNVTYGTTTGVIQVDILKNTAYTVFIDAQNFSTNTTVFNSNASAFQVLNFILYPNNAVFFNVFYEATGLRFNETNTTIVVANIGASYNTTVNSTGQALIRDIIPGNYTVTVLNPRYSLRQLEIVITNRSSQTVNIYMTNGTNVLFNFKTISGAVIPGVLLNVFRSVNGSRTLVTSKVSDVSGVSQVALETTGLYEFETFAIGFNNYSFSLNPVLFTSYDIILTSSGGGNVVIPSATITFTPTSFFRFQNVNFNIQFLSQFDSLQSYSYNVTYPGGAGGGSGNNSHGESFNHAFNLNNVTPGSRVFVFYEYTLDNGVYFNTTISYPIVYVASNRTWASMGNNINQTTGQDSTTGYYVGERVIIVTLISIVMFGVGWAIGGGIGGLVFALIPILFFTNAGFVPKELYYVTLFFTVIFFISKGADS